MTKRQRRLREKLLKMGQRQRRARHLRKWLRQQPDERPIRMLVFPDIVIDTFIKKTREVAHSE